MPRSEQFHLGPLEREVMEVLWDHSGLTVRQVIDRVSGEPAYTTIATVLANLKRKELACSEREGRSTVYRPRVSRADHAAAVMGGVLAASRDRDAAILRFADAMSDDDVALLRGYLEAGRGGSSGDGMEDR